MQEIEHGGFKIKFDQSEEEWIAKISDSEWVRDKSLKKLKEYLDKLNKKEFKRIPIFVHVNRYSRGDKYEPRYGQATITSVSPNGNAYYVEKGSKHAQKEGLRYCYLYEDTAENRTIIEEYEALSKQNFEIEQKMKAASDKIKNIDGNELFKSLY